MPLGTFVHDQFEALDVDLRPAAVKTGMLLSAPHISMVRSELGRRDWGPLVVDPVMVAKSGDRLLEERRGVEAMRKLLLPLATVVTPNWPEAAALTGQTVDSRGRRCPGAGRAICGLGAEYVVVKGGHSRGEPNDLVINRESVTRLTGTRVDTRHTHGTGCTFSAAIAAIAGPGTGPASGHRPRQGIRYGGDQIGSRAGERPRPTATLSPRLA